MQFARPSSDTLLSSWSNQAASTVTVYTAINEVTQEDTSFVQSQLLPTSGLWYVTRLTSIGDPLTGDSHTVSYAYERSSEAGGGQCDLEVELREGFVSTVTPGTSIASWTHTAISTSWTSAAQTLTTVQANLITQYSSMFLIFKPKQV